MIEEIWKAITKACITTKKFGIHAAGRPYIVEKRGYSYHVIVNRYDILDRDININNIVIEFYSTDEPNTVEIEFSHVWFNKF